MLGKVQQDEVMVTASAKQYSDLFACVSFSYPLSHVLLTSSVPLRRTQENVLATEQAYLLRYCIQIYFLFTEVL